MEGKTREEILKAYEDIAQGPMHPENLYFKTGQRQRLLLEVLLDIRDLLQRDEPKEEHYFAIVYPALSLVVGCTSDPDWYEEGHELVEISKRQFQTFGDDPGQWQQFGDRAYLDAGALRCL